MCGPAGRQCAILRGILAPTTPSVKDCTKDWPRFGPFLCYPVHVKRTWRILLYKDSLYLQSLGARLQDFPGIEVLQPDADEVPDIVLVSSTGRDLTPALGALQRYPGTPVLVLNMLEQRLTALSVTTGPAETPADLLEAIARLTGARPGAPEDED